MSFCFKRCAPTDFEWLILRTKVGLFFKSEAVRGLMRPQDDFLDINTCDMSIAGGSGYIHFFHLQVVLSNGSRSHSFANNPQFGGTAIFKNQNETFFQSEAARGRMRPQKRPLDINTGYISFPVFFLSEWIHFCHLQAALSNGNRPKTREGRQRLPKLSENINFEI